MNLFLLFIIIVITIFLGLKGKKEGFNKKAVSNYHLKIKKNFHLQLLCKKKDGEVKNKMIYLGPKTCLTANLFEHGPSKCQYACLGFGDCKIYCPSGSLIIKDNFLEIINELCFNCGKCVEICPRNVLNLIPSEAKIFAPCRTKEIMKQVSTICKSGCIACHRCLKRCPYQAITRVNKQLSINHQICIANYHLCRAICVDECPRKLLEQIN